MCENNYLSKRSEILVEILLKWIIGTILLFMSTSKNVHYFLSFYFFCPWNAHTSTVRGQDTWGT